MTENKRESTEQAVGGYNNNNDFYSSAKSV